MAIVWLVTIGDQERNFRYKREAVAWLVRLARDTRPNPPIYREHRTRFYYYGPGELKYVTRAYIDRLGFPPLKYYATKKGRGKPAKEPPSANAIDPSAQPPGTLDTRGSTSSSSSETDQGRTPGSG